MNSQYQRPGISLLPDFLGRMKTAMTLVFAMLFIAATSNAQNPEVRKAFRLIDIEQPSKGLAALEQLASGTPNSYNLYYLGLAQLRAGQKDKALANFEKGIAANEKDGLNYAGKAHVRLLEKNPTDAKANIDKALQVSKSKDVNVLKAVAEAYLTDTKYLLDAINLLNKAAGINGSDPEVQMLLGDAALVQNAQNAGPAVTAYEKAGRADTKYAKPHYKVGKLYQRAKNLEVAVSSYEKAIQIDPEYAPAYKELGQIAYLNKESQKAVDAYEKYIKLTENPGDAKFQLAFFYFMNKQYDKANAIFQEVTTNPNVPAVAYKFYALSLIQQAKGAEAVSMYEKYFQKAKKEDITADDYAEYAKVQLESKRPGGDSLANVYFAEAIKMDTAVTAEVLQLHADTYMKRKKFPEAIDAYKQLIASRKQPLSQDLYSIGRAYYMNENFLEADSAFTQLAEKQPNMTVGPLWAGRARQHIDSTGTHGLAKPMYEQVIEKASTNPDKYKKDLIEAYDYLGTYTLQIEKNVVKSKEFFQKILAIDPNYERAKEFMKELAKPAPKG
jgi:tetratricopeptide (TPR) repeat protein